MLSGSASVLSDGSSVVRVRSDASVTIFVFEVGDDPATDFDVEPHAAKRPVMHTDTAIAAPARLRVKGAFL